MAGRRGAAGMRGRDGGGGQVVASEDSPGSGQAWLPVICVRALIVPLLILRLFRSPPSPHHRPGDVQRPQPHA